MLNIYRFLDVRCAPMLAGAGSAGRGEHVFQSLCIAFFHGLLKGVQGLLEQARLGQQFFAVGQQNVAPHLGVARSDAGEVAVPGPASDKKSSPFDCPVMLFIMANANRCGR